KPDDLKGMKIRYAAGPIFKGIYEALGANPLQMSFADLQPALSTGAVDGQENPINLFLAFKMDTLAQKHLTIWNYCADAGIFHVAKSVWDSFSKQDQEIITESAREAAKRQIAGTRKGLGLDGDSASLDEVKKRGVEISALTLEEKDVFAKATRPVFDKWAATIGADLVKKAEGAIKARAEHISGVVPPEGGAPSHRRCLGSDAGRRLLDRPPSRAMTTNVGGQIGRIRSDRAAGKAAAHLAAPQVRGSSDRRRHGRDRGDHGRERRGT